MVSNVSLRTNSVISSIVHAYVTNDQLVKPTDHNTTRKHERICRREYTNTCNHHKDAIALNGQNDVQVPTDKKCKKGKMLYGYKN